MTQRDPNSRNEPSGGPIDYPARLRAALAALQKQQARIDELEQQLHEPIAIIGMGCRFPGGASSPQRFWALLRDGVDAIEPVPPDRWAVEEFYDPDPETPGKTYTKTGGFLRGVDLFDARFFRISAREAASMDPQQRLLLEVSWEALEDAAVPGDTLAGSATGVFVGLTVEDYAKLVSRTDLTRADVYTATGNVANIAAGRLSYFYGFRGPSLAVDTACSSSLVSVHLACQSLRAGECDMALAAGVNLILAPDNTIAVSRARMLSPDGRCKAFDARADGYARSEGCGVVVLERLSRAVAQGRRVLAVIRGSAVRQDGARSGLTVPNGPAQQAVMDAALRSAHIEPAEVGYVEAHGTGTALGDPIEIEAIAGVYGGRSRAHPLVIGALKTSVGHMESAAGIGGVIKTALTLQHGRIPPHLHLQTVNPEIYLDEIPATIPRVCVPWPDGYGRRLAGISSFGSSGTIAHVILEAPPAVTPSTADTHPQWLSLSAATEPALADLAGSFDEFLSIQPDEALADICHTARVGRSRFGRRVAVVARSAGEMRTRLRAAMTGRAAGRTQGRMPGRAPEIGFFFTGQGALHAGMGRRLYEAAPVFRAAIDWCADLLRDDLPRPLAEMLFDNGSDELLEDTQYGQPALFALQHAFVLLWRSWGIRPAVVCGHSLGEYAAAWAAGILEPDAALRLVVARGRLMKETAPGRMAAVFAGETACRDAIVGEPQVAIAAINADDETILSGDPDAIDRCLARLRARGLTARALRVDRAFHSPLMRPVVDKFAPLLRATSFKPARVRVLAAVTGRWAGPEDLARADYWLEQVTSPVRFASCVAALAAADVPLVIEVGPAPVLTALGQRSRSAAAVQWLPSIRPDGDPLESMLETLAACYTAGAEVEGRALARGDRRLVAIPTYPFQRERHWVDAPERPSSRPVERDAVAASERRVAPQPQGPPRALIEPGRLSFGVMFFNGLETEAGPERYRFVMEVARFADEHGFSSVWLPERHFTNFGGLYPNPATLHAAIARETGRVRLMAGSVVLPLHQLPRIAEEWALVDNLSGGRVGMSFASGWNPDDFALAPDQYRDRHEQLFQGIEELRRLWRGETVDARNGLGQVTSVRAYPTPVQPELPLWVTAAANPATFERAGSIGAHLLTHLLDHDVHELAEKVARYRAARKRHGHDPDAGQVVVMLHTFVGDDERAVHDRVRGPYCDFLKANAHLLKGLATSRGTQTNLDSLSPADRDAFVGFLYDRFFSKRGLIGTPESCEALLGQLQDIGVNEIACLLDFGPAPEDVLASLPSLLQLVERMSIDAPSRAARPALVAGIASMEPSAGRGASAAPTAEESGYRISWREVALARSAHTAKGHGGGRSWIVCVDRGGVGARVVEWLLGSGQPCVAIERPASSTDGRPDTTGDSDSWWEDDLRAAVTAAPTAVVLYLWHLDAREGATVAALADAVSVARVVSTVSTFSTVSTAGSGRTAPRIWFVSRDAQLVAGHDVIVSPTQASLWGLARVLPIEEPRLWGGLIDLTSAADEATSAALIVDAATSEAREDQLACRDGRFFAARLTPSPLPPASRPVICRADAAYLVTGGFGGLGLAAAGWLVDKGARTLVLGGRTPLPPRAEWDTLPATHRCATAVRAVIALERRGVTVETAAYDVGAPDVLRSYIERRAAEGRPAVRGVIHAAGTWHDAPFTRVDAAMLTAVLQPKVAGTDALERVFPDESLDFFIAFSAFSSMLPAERQASYAAANAYLDAAMVRRRQRGGVAVAIDWGPWSEIGFATSEYGARAHERLQALGINRLTPAEGLRILDRLAAGDSSTFGVMPVAWGRLFQADPNASLSPLLSELLARYGAESDSPTGAADGPLARAVLEAPGSEQAGRLRHGLREILATVMRTDPPSIPDETPFTELGVDSLMAVEMKNRIQQETGIALPLVQLLDGPSVVSLTATVLAAIKMAVLTSRATPSAAGADLEEIEI